MRCRAGTFAPRVNTLFSAPRAQVSGYRRARVGKLVGFVSISPLISRSNFQKTVSRFAKVFVLIGAMMCVAGGLQATGYYGPDVYLDNGGKNVDGSPEFYWGLEIRRICREFHPTEKLVISEESKTISDEDQPAEKKISDVTTKTDLKDFDAALSEGRIKPPDSGQAKEQHKAAREALDSTFVGTPKRSEEHTS